MILCVLADIMRFASTILRPRAQLVAENLFLRKQSRRTPYCDDRSFPMRRVGAETRHVVDAQTHLRVVPHEKGEPGKSWHS
jgi:hypothetical protein